ncbi:hypothetical protein [Helicobacter magdeburgensis]|nr:hypothetical protein [Helicobacter magdeburgensis]
MNLQVWISAYARMRSRLVVVPLAPPYISPTPTTLYKVCVSRDLILHA